MIKAIVCILIIFFATSCNSNGVNTTAKKHITSVNATGNDFNPFFKEFKTDSGFQKAHVHFPLKYKISGGEGEADSMKLITANEWKFTQLFISNEGKLILKKIKKSATEIDVQVQIKDTGFENEFTFLKKSNSWFLDSVTDNSD